MLQNETNKRNTASLAVIADDITGSFDTGVQFQKRGSAVRFALASQLPESLENVQVLVIDAETRHACAEETYAQIHRLALWTAQMGIAHLYIKTDSGLRGHIGMALKAALDALNCNLCGFAPAYPDMDRITRDGQQIISGVPLHHSVFGQDLFDPVQGSGIRDMILPSGVAVKEMGLEGRWDTRTTAPTVAVFDAVCNEDFDRIAAHLQAMDQLKLTAGCAAFASHLPQVLGLPNCPAATLEIHPPLLVVCGSLNPITRAQLEFGERHGCVRCSMSMEQLLDKAYLDSPEGMAWLEKLRCCLRERRTLLIDTAVQPQGENAAPIDVNCARVCIAAHLGRLMIKLISMPEAAGYMPMIIGGDTLMGFLSQLSAPEVMLEGENVPGVVCFSIKWRNGRFRMLSKSGGFGGETLFQDMLCACNTDA